MRLNRKLPLLALAGGLLGAALRAMQLKNAFEPITGLYLKGNLWGRLLLVWLAVATLALAAAAVQGAYHAGFEALFAGSGDLYKTALAFEGLLLAACGAGWLFVEIPEMTSAKIPVEPWVIMLEIPFGLLCIAGGFCMIGLGAVLTRGELGKRQALLTLPPMFWAPFHLLVTYRQYCVSANLALFMMEICASVACVMAYYHFARMLYGKPCPRRFSFWAAEAVMLSLSDVGGYAAGVALGEEAVHWSLGTCIRGAALLLGCAFLLTELFVLTTRFFPPLPDGEQHG